MLKSLVIRNYALIDELAVEFSGGLVIITGETGAGKSIIIDALGLIIGERASVEVVRAGADKAIVEGVFDTTGNRKVKALLKENDLEEADELIIRREVSARGQSRCFVNDTPATITLQKQIGELLVDLHGQHEHQSLLRVDMHCDMLDDFGGLDGMVDEFRTAFTRLSAVAAELRALREREQQLQEKSEFHRFQIQEIDAVAPQAGEEERLETELSILENSEKLSATTAAVYGTLYEGEQSIHDLLVIVRNQLRDLVSIDKQFEAASAESESAVAIVGELAKFIQRYNAGVEHNPERLEELRQRLGRLALLKKKYGGSVESILAYRERIGQEAALAENFDEVIGRLTGDLELCRTECGVLAQRLSAKRVETARKLDKAIVGELMKLGIQHAAFVTKITQEELRNPEENGQYVRSGKKLFRLNPKGHDGVEFFISTNRGEDVRPLAKVASGGEISRIMLALKSILAKSDRLPVLIFDEIDVGVSGRVAQAVGFSLKTLSGFHQVIAITHLPQIAGLADVHFSVVKLEAGKRATTAIRKLSMDERVREVAKLMSGAEVTEAGLKGARELMGVTPNTG